MSGDSPKGPASRTSYVGRFAPSPTGPLHFGSLVAAVGSFLQARHCGGRWLLRIEDLDPPRESPTAADQILRTLDEFGLEWDGPVLYQSRRHPAYMEALDLLADLGLTYRCACSRKDLRMALGDSQVDPDLGPVYPGICRHRHVGPREPHSIRIRTTAAPISFDDLVQGPQKQNLAGMSGDFVLRRRDGLFSYQLAVVVDDAAQGVTEIVRGADLLSQTPRQIYLQRLLRASTPAYVHLPVVVDSAGRKLSKQTGATDVRASQNSPVIWQVLSFLCQRPPPELRMAPSRELLSWAIPNWRTEPLKGPARRPLNGINHKPPYDV